MKTVAIVGANGLVGKKMLDILNNNLPELNVRLFGNTSVGDKVEFRNRSAVVEPCDALSDGGIDYAVFVATEEVSARYIPPLASRGVICIDNSAHFRLCTDVPLVVPCINGRKIDGHNIIANPNCSTIQTVIALNALMPLCPTKFTAVTYQSASGAGKQGLDDLNERNGYGKLRCFKHPLFDNILPAIGAAENDGFTVEERKMMRESKKILDLPHLKVNAFCARVPVSVGHCVFVNVRLKKKFTVDEVRQLLHAAPNVLLFDDAPSDIYPLPSMMRNTKYVGVGRITKDPTANAVNMFTVADNLLRGASYNAYEILQYIVQHKENANA